LEPIHVQAAIEASRQLQEQEDQRHRALRLALEKAEFEAGRIRRQYDAADPENRLVAGELEGRLEQALRQVRDLEDRLEAAKRPADPLIESQRQRLMELGCDVRRAWDHPAAPVALKKRVLRTVLVEIVADLLDDPARVSLRFHWAGGVHTHLLIPKNRTGQHRHTTDREVMDLMRDLAKVCDDPRCRPSGRTPRRSCGPW